MATFLNVADLLTERAKLLARVEEINRALEALKAGATRAVRIRTHRNVRNTAGLTTNPDSVDNRTVLVFADESLTVRGDPGDHGGYISGADWAWIKANPGGVGDISED